MTTSITAATENLSGSFPLEVCNLLLGKGGSGQVFLGRLGSSSRYVAIKKRYARSDPSSPKSAFPLVSAPGWSRVLPSLRSPTAQTAGFPPSCGYREEGSSQNADMIDGLPASQRREHDLGEESASQVAALSQQSCGVSSGALDTRVTGLARQAAAFVLTDEVSVLHFVGPHPQIVEFFGSYTTSKNTSFLTLELMDSDVDRELKENNKGIQNEAVCAAVAYSVLLALDELHSRAIAHRDVKPGNILLKHLSEAEHWPCCCLHGDGSGDFSAVTEPPTPVGSPSFVKVALGDFSAAHSICCADDVAFSDTRGTLHYKAPEQLLGKRSIVTQNFAAVDLWGLGCTLFEMMTGGRPFPGSSELQVLMSILDALGSDFQSYPALTRGASLFDKVSASASCVDLLQLLLCLDPARRCTAKEALDHPFFASVRRSDLTPGQAPPVPPGLPRPPHIIGIPLALKYATVTQIPGLRFSRILRSSATPAENPPDANAPAPGLSSGPETLGTGAASESSDDAAADAMAAAAVPAESHDEPPQWDAEADTAEWHQPAEGRAKDTPSTAGAGVPNSDTTVTSFFSESSFLHWSEIGPITRQPAPLPTQPALSLPPPPVRDSRGRSSSRARVVTIFGAGVNSSIRTSSLESRHDHHRQQSHSSSARHASDVLGRLTVSRALNISDSSVKAVPARRSSSHIDFDLSPVTATQLFSADADVSTCAVPHTGLALAARRPQPVLHLTSGSTFTASNLRANSSFERENHLLGAGGGGGGAAGAAGASSGAAALGDQCRTPRQGGSDGGAQRPNAFAGRALCFSEETDRRARRSWGSSTSQQSYLNSLRASPAPVGRVTDGTGGGSPQPSPIRPIVDVVRSPSGLPATVTERIGLSSDDSGVGLGWIGAPVLSCGAAALLRDLHSDGVAASTWAAAVPVISSVHVPPLLTAGKGACQFCSVSPSPRRCCVARTDPSMTGGGIGPRARGGSSITSSSLGATELVRVPSEAVLGGRASASAIAATGVGRGGAAGSRSLPLPIPLSVATVCQGSQPAAASMPSSRALQATPRTQRFSSATAELRRAGERSGCALSATPLPAGPCAVQGLRERDGNVPPPTRGTHRHGKADAGPPVAGSQVVLHRHCTPSRSPVGMAQGPHPAVSPSSTPAHAHTPVLMHHGAKTCELRHLLGDGSCTATPQSTRPTSMKRSREEGHVTDAPSSGRLGARVEV